MFTLGKRIYPFFFIFLVSTFSAAAESDSPTVYRKYSGNERWIQADSRWTVYGSTLAGYGAASGSEFVKSPSGDQYILSGLFSYESKHWVQDIGLGWMVSHLSTQFGNGGQMKITTRAGMAEYGARVRLGRRWQVGPELNLAFGTDTSFAPSIGTAISTPFVGARVVYETPLTIFPLRIVSEALTEVNPTIPDKRVVLVMAGVQFGIPFGLPKAQERPIHMSQSAPMRPEDENIEYELNPALFHFYVKSNELTPESVDYLKGLAEYLKTHESDWTSIEVMGHADIRGAHDMNQELSVARANAVAKLFSDQGLGSSKLQIEGFSYDRPLDPARTRAAYARNRRVEVVLKGVRDQDLLTNHLQDQDQPKDIVWEKRRGNP